MTSKHPMIVGCLFRAPDSANKQVFHVGSLKLWHIKIWSRQHLKSATHIQVTDKINGQLYSHFHLRGPPALGRNRLRGPCFILVLYAPAAAADGWRCGSACARGRWTDSCPTSRSGRRQGPGGSPSLYGCCGDFHSLLLFMALGSSPCMLPDTCLQTSDLLFTSWSAVAVSWHVMARLPLRILRTPLPRLQQFSLPRFPRQPILGDSSVRNDKDFPDSLHVPHPQS